MAMKGRPLEALKKLLELVMDQIVATTGSSVADLFVPSDDGESLRVIQSSDASRVAILVSVKDSTMGQAFRNKTPIYSGCLPGFKKLTDPDSEVGPTSYDYEIAFPLIFNSESIGVINIESHEKITWNEKQEKNLLAVIEQTPMIVALIKQAERLRAEENAAVARGTMATIGELTHNFVHDLGNAVGLLGAGLQKIEDKISEGSLSSEISIILRELQEQIEAALQLPEQFKRKISAITEIREFNIKSLFEEVIESVGSKHNVEFSVIVDPNVRTIRAYGEFKDVLRNLVQNALKAIDSEGKIILSSKGVGQSKKKKGKETTYFGVQISVQDNGPGISDDVCEHLFELGTSTRKEGIGFGIGLWIVRMFAKRCMGSVTAENVDPHGARFTLTLPTSVSYPVSVEDPFSNHHISS